MGAVYFVSTSIVATEVSMAEHRSSPRKRAFLKGTILFNNGASSLDCLIREISETGARLEATGAVTLPEVFTLSIPQKGASQTARIVWRRDELIGVIFEDAASAPLTDLEERVRQLEAEVLQLKVLLLQMAAHPEQRRSAA